MLGLDTAVVTAKAAGAADAAAVAAPSGRPCTDAAPALAAPALAAYPHAGEPYAHAPHPQSARAHTAHAHAEQPEERGVATATSAWIATAIAATDADAERVEDHLDHLDRRRRRV